MSTHPPEVFSVSDWFDEDRLTRDLLRHVWTLSPSVSWPRQPEPKLINRSIDPALCTQRFEKSHFQEIPDRRQYDEARFAITRRTRPPWMVQATTAPRFARGYPGDLSGLRSAPVRPQSGSRHSASGKIKVVHSLENRT